MKDLWKNKLNLIAIIIGLAPIVFFYWFRYQNVTNTPIWDDYGAVLAFLNNYYSTPSWIDRIPLIFEKYAEHRLFYVRFVTLLDYYVFGKVNFIHLNLIGNLGLLGLAFLFYKVLPKSDNRILYTVTIVFLLFQLQYFTVNFCSMSALQNINTVLFAFTSLFLLSKVHSLDKDHTKYFLFALFFAGMANFSSGNGMFTFPAGILLLYGIKSPRNYQLAWISASVIFIALYFYGYTSSPGGNRDIIDGYTDASPLRATGKALSNPDEVFSFFFTFMGSAFKYVPPSFGNSYAYILGFISFIYVLYLIQIKYFKRNPLISAFLLFLILSALSVAIMRRAGGVNWAVMPRYHFFSVLTIIVLFYTILDIFNLHNKRTFAIWGMVLSIAFYFSVFDYSYDKLNNKKKQLILGANSYLGYTGNGKVIKYGPKGIVQNVPSALRESQNLATSPHTQGQARKIIKGAMAREVYQLPYTNLQPAGEILNDSLPDEFGDIQFYIKIIGNKKTIKIENAWALIPGDEDKGNRSHLVLISDSYIYMYKTSLVRRYELAKIFNSKAYLNPGFKLNIPKEELMPGKYKIGILVAKRDKIKGFILTGETEIVEDKSKSSGS